MKGSIAVGLLVCLAGSAASGTADAAVAQFVRTVNAVDNCQAFTPGPSNTIRNRVTGAENVGTVPIAIACNFAHDQNGAAGNTFIKQVRLFFTNNTGATTTMNCTLLTGPGPNGVVGSGAIFASTKSVSIANGTWGEVTWTQADNPTSGAVDLGNYMVGVNCTLPPNVVFTTTQIIWNADNGV